MPRHSGQRKQWCRTQEFSYIFILGEHLSVLQFQRTSIHFFGNPWSLIMAKLFKIVVQWRYPVVPLFCDSVWNYWLPFKTSSDSVNLFQFLAWIAGIITMLAVVYRLRGDIIGYRNKSCRAFMFWRTIYPKPQNLSSIFMFIIWNDKTVTEINGELIACSTIARRVGNQRKQKTKRPSC